MSQTVVRNVSEPSPASHPRPSRQRGPVEEILMVAASLRITVVLFALAIALVFFGTLAQVDEGLWTVLSKYFRAWWSWIPFQIFVRFGQIFFDVPKSVTVPGRFPFPGGWLLGALLLGNLLAAHAVRFKLTWKRFGVLLLHAGIVVMMVSELITGLFAHERRMFIPTGQETSILQDHRKVELAIVDPSPADHDDVVTIPDSLLRRGGTIDNELLPFAVEVRQYMVNSDFRALDAPDPDNPATAGDGLRYRVTEEKEASGASSAEDIASAYVTFKEKGTGKSLGTYLVSQYLTYPNRPMPPVPQRVTCGGKTYDVYLRYQFTHMPFTVHLLEFHHDVYLGTDTPRNYSSRVRLVDPSQNEDRDVVISMNEPLRYAGETFYQSGVLPGDRGTILQVVNNPGWLMPYISCLMVSLGMSMHFLIKLVSFLRRKGVQ